MHSIWEIHNESASSVNAMQTTFIRENVVTNDFVEEMPQNQLAKFRNVAKLLTEPSDHGGF